MSKRSLAFTILFVVAIFAVAFSCALAFENGNVVGGRADYLVTIILSFVFLFWSITMTYRVQFKTPKNVLHAITIVGFFWILLRFVKWLPNILTLAKYIDYLYYLPMILFPSLFLAFCVETFHSNLKGKKWLYLAVALISTLFVVLSLTNDLHELIYKNYHFNADEHGVIVARLATYSYGFMHYAAMAYIFALILTAFVVTVIGAKPTPLQAILPVGVVVIATVYFVLYAVGVRFLHEAFFLKDLALVSILLLQFGIETMLDVGLVQNNGRYVGNFSRSMLPMCIYDEKGRTLYKSDGFFETLKYSEAQKVRSSSKNIGDYTLVSQADISEIINLKQNIENENAELSRTNLLLENTLNLTRERASITHRLELSNEIENSIGKSREDLKKLVDSLPDKMTDDNFEKSKRTLGKIAMILGYMKQKCMLLLGAKERRLLSAEEFKMLLNVVVHDIQSVGFEKIAFTLTSNGDVDFALAIAVNELLNEVAHAYEFLDLEMLVVVNQTARTCSLELDGKPLEKKPFSVPNAKVVLKDADNGLRITMEVSND